jgi:hypothetical protein
MMTLHFIVVLWGTRGESVAFKTSIFRLKFVGCRGSHDVSILAAAIRRFDGRGRTGSGKAGRSNNRHNRER